MSSEKIEPCPWCGAATDVEDVDPSMKWHVVCHQRLAMGPGETTRGEAIAAWNSVALAARRDSKT